MKFICLGYGEEKSWDGPTDRRGVELRVGKLGTTDSKRKS